MTSDTFKEKHNPQEARAHTPTPWRAVDELVQTVGEREQRMPFGIGGESGPNSVTLRRDDSKPPMTWVGPDFICEMRDDVPAAEREANAAFIVRACNSHEELLEALEALHKASSEMVNRYGPRGNVHDATYQWLQVCTMEAGKVLVRAKGEAS